MFSKWCLPLILLTMAGCVKDRVLPLNAPGPGTSQVSEIKAGMLVINEFVVSGSPNVNEFGTPEDWIEIYNPSYSAFTMSAGEWFISDAGPSDPKKYTLPHVVIPARGFLVVWCDNKDTVATQIHANFALSSQGEHLVVYHESKGTGTVIDAYEYGPGIPSGQSKGRAPDGGENWVLFTHPTIGASNQ